MSLSSKEAYLKETIKLTNAKKVNATLNGHHPQIQQLLERIFRIAKEPINVAVMGEFSTGKSSFINKILKIDALPVSILPKTATITKIVYGKEQKVEFDYEFEGQITVQEHTGYDSFKGLQIASKINDPLFLKELDHLREVRVYVNNPLLKKFSLIDTPGFNHDVAMDEKSLGILDQVDIVIWIADYTQVAKKTEFEKLLSIKKKLKHLYLIINKADIHIDGSESYNNTERELLKSLKENKFLDFFSSDDFYLISCKSNEKFWDGIFQQFMAKISESFLNEDLELTISLIDEKVTLLKKELQNEFSLFNNINDRINDIAINSKVNNIISSQKKELKSNTNIAIGTVRFALSEHCQQIKSQYDKHDSILTVNAFIHDLNLVKINDKFKDLQNKYNDYFNNFKNQYIVDLISKLETVLNLLPDNFDKEKHIIINILSYYKLIKVGNHNNINLLLPATSRTLELLDQLSIQFINKQTINWKVPIDFIASDSIKYDKTTNRKIKVYDYIYEQLTISLLEDFKTDIERTIRNPVVNEVFQELSLICNNSMNRLRSSLAILE